MKLNGNSKTSAKTCPSPCCLSLVVSSSRFWWIVLIWGVYLTMLAYYLSRHSLIWMDAMSASSIYISLSVFRPSVQCVWSEACVFACVCVCVCEHQVWDSSSRLMYTISRDLPVSPVSFLFNFLSFCLFFPALCFFLPICPSLYLSDSYSLFLHCRDHLPLSCRVLKQIHKLKGTSYLWPYINSQSRHIFLTEWVEILSDMLCNFLQCSSELMFTPMVLLIILVNVFLLTSYIH